MAATLQSVKLQSHLSTVEVTISGKTANETYVVLYDGMVSARTAASAAGLPSIGSTHPDDSSLRVTARSAKLASEDTRTIFQVAVTYTTNTVLENPLTVPANITWDFADSEKIALFEDCSDTPKLIINTAGEPFENFLEQDTGSLTVTITKNIAANGYNPATWLPFMQPKAVNSDPITIDGHTIAAGKAKFASVSCGSVQESNGMSYRVLTIKIDLRNSWDTEIESRGFNESDGGTPKKLKEISKGIPAGSKPDFPWPLDEEGAAMPNADDPPAKLTFKTQPAVAYSAITSYFA